ncbi:alpha/beta fold hydrolase [Paeniglutamicibacter cryotolerans]|uniref:Pimeloyl-ACP methyl ester carboxylesterase n=1 Tax=Paeniglutamicibacter cryotolerans TaxID=670079 RepID=A0A839QI56_9MICC|nr:alpha/beta hydrolase [Paeniglutamicibacter cryotolerans]MBB2994424.1 pimeloyl-ACP methyl ester carboxylesterase [Paeniglutamicibacter cryotolerans]
MPYAVNPLDGNDIYFDDGATGGRSVLMLHGSALSRSIWRGLGYVKALEPEFNTIRMDLRGHGRSAKPHRAKDYEMELVLADVLAVLDAAEVDSVHVLGYSFGARMGLQLAAAAPGRLRSLTLLGGTYRIDPGALARLFFADYRAALLTGGMEAFVAGMEAESGSLDPATRLAFLSNDPLALAAYFEYTESAPAMSELLLRQLHVPTLLMAGTRDRPRLEDSMRAAELMPDARAIELPGRTHGGTLFPPREILDALLPFLRSVDAR